MGRPFDREIARLSRTYAWAVDAPVDEIARVVVRLCGRPMYAVGSGGSYSVAQAAAWLHEAYCSTMARAMTPLDVVTGRRRWRDAAALIVSAGGSNPDVCAAASALVRAEPVQLAVLTGRRSSPLTKIVAAARGQVASYSLPGGKDGYLATSSAVASIVLLGRAYAECAGLGSPFPARIEELLGEALPAVIASVADSTTELWRRSTILALHGPVGTVAASDLESKCVEAALHSVLVADYRHFAHGRHYWLHRRASDSAVIAYASREERAIAERTLALLPRSIPRHLVELTHEGPVGLLEGLVHTLLLVQAAGRADGTDPGRPSVPQFGRKLYHLRGLRARPIKSNSPASGGNATVAIARKAAPPDGLDESLLRKWSDAYLAALQQLRAATFQAVVLDYDGTLCASDDPEAGVAERVVPHLRRLARSGVPMGVATGRGASALREMRAVLPRSSWASVAMGYYNGALCLRLSDELPDRVAMEAGPAIREATSRLEASLMISSSATLTRRPHQLTLRPHVPWTLDWLWFNVSGVVSTVGEPSMEVLRSTWSIDVLAPNVRKTRVVEMLIAMGAHDSGPPRVLRIGDRGQWPGNDYLLLDSPDGLSVGTVSGHPENCWNLAPAGMGEVEATEYYLSHLECEDRQLRFVGV